MKSAQVKTKQVLFAHILLCAIFLAMVTFLNPEIIVRNDDDCLQSLQEAA